jgi:hypothetical protein
VLESYGEQEGKKGDDAEINGVLPDAENVVGARQEQESVRKTDPGYRLRPEMLESLHDAYPVDRRRIILAIFLRIIETCRAGS